MQIERLVARQIRAQLRDAAVRVCQQVHSEWARRKRPVADHQALPRRVVAPAIWQQQLRERQSTVNGHIGTQSCCRCVLLAAVLLAPANQLPAVLQPPPLPITSDLGLFARLQIVLCNVDTLHPLETLHVASVFAVGADVDVSVCSEGVHRVQERLPRRSIIRDTPVGGLVPPLLSEHHRGGVRRTRRIVGGGQEGGGAATSWAEVSHWFGGPTAGRRDEQHA